MIENTIATRRNGKYSLVEGIEELKGKKTACTNRYKKLPALKGKYNEPYHDGLYRFQDVPKFLEIGTGSEGIDEVGGGLLSTSFQKSGITEELNMPIKDCTDKL